MVERGFVALVGAGPGDPDLITVSGRDQLARADVLVYDSLCDPALLELAPAHAERIYAGKRARTAAMPQAAINALLVERARAGKRVVRLKGGDPYVFGRGAEEAEYLHAAGIPFLVVPGITAALGAGACAGLPPTHRDDASTVAFVTGHHDPRDPNCPVDWSNLAAFRGNLMIYMAVGHLDTTCQTLIERGRSADTPAAVVQDATRPSQRVIRGTLADLGQRALDAGIRSPSLLVVGPAVAREPVLDWYARRPLAGQRILVTRPKDEAERSARPLVELGAEVIHAPTIDIVPARDRDALDRAIDRLEGHDWLVFTSRHGVRYFMQRVMERSDIRALGRVEIATIGPGTTNALSVFHLRPDIVAASESSEGLVEALLPHVGGKRVLLVRANRGRDVLPAALGSVADVEQVVAYEQRDRTALPDHVVRLLESGEVDWITLTSPAIAERFHALIPPGVTGHLGGATKIATISPLTSETVRRFGWSVAAEAAPHTWEGIVSAIRQHHRSE